MPAATKKPAAPKPVDALAERARLFELMNDIDRRGDEHSAAFRAARTALDAAEATLAEARVGEVMGTATADDVTRATTARDHARRALAELDEPGKAIKTARSRAHRELTTLYHRNRDAFEAEAEELSKAAESALKAIGPALRDAANAWAVAAGNWNTLQRWLNERPGKLVPEDQLGPVPAFPLPLAVRDTQPRPHARRQEMTTELVPDRIAVFNDLVSGKALRAPVGGVLWRDAMASSRFEFVKFEAAQPQK